MTKFIIFAKNKLLQRQLFMKKLILILVFIGISIPLAMKAQDIALGERMPKFLGLNWLNNQIPSKTPYYYMEFFSTQNPHSIAFLERLNQLKSKFGSQISIILVASEPEEVIRPYIEPYLGNNFAIILDHDKMIHSKLKIHFVPFGMLLNARHRIVWMGRFCDFDDSIISNL